MPTLKDLHCSIELSNSGQPLQEMGTVYGDACVETFISVPKERHKFTIHLSSTNFIAPGIAMYVFIDGVYQCNRNRQNLEPRMPPDRRSLVDFRVRQKEEIQKDGSMVAREWTFERPHSRPPNILEDIGCIEVVVLRCDGSRDAKTTADMNLDGAADYPDYRSDRSRRSRRTAYDDRDPIVGPAGNRHVPPPFPLYHSPYAETVRSQEGAATQHWRSTDGREQSPVLKEDHFKRVHHQRSEPVGPGTRPRRDIPAPAFHYGNGPLPPRSVAETQRDLIAEAISSEVPKSAPTMDPTLLEKIIADAVKRGVEESRKHASPGSRRSSRAYEHDTESSSQIPGAWPTSPTHPEQSRARSTHHNRARDSDGGDSTWKHPERKPRSTGSKADTRVAWDQELGWDNASKVDGWDSDTASDPWDTDEPWSHKRHDGWKDIRRSKSKARITRSPSPSPIASPAFDHSARKRSRHARSRKARAASRWREDRESSGDEKDGWTHIAAPSDSSTSSSRSDSTLKPSQSRSQVQSSRRTAKRRTSRRSEHEQLQLRPQHIETPWHTGTLHPPSVLITNAQPPPPTLAPISHFPSSVHPQPQHPATQPAAPVLAPPPPTWGCATAAPSRWKSGSTYVLPAPFSSVGMGRARARRGLGGGSSWGGGVDGAKTSKHGEKKREKKKEERAQTVWGGEGEGAWGEGEAMEWDGEGEGWGGGGEGGDADAEKGWGGGDTDTEQGWGGDASVVTEDAGWETLEERGDAWGAFGADGTSGTSGTWGTQGAGWGWEWDTHKHFDVDNANNPDVNPDTNDNDTWTPAPKPSTLKRPKPTKKPNTHPAAPPLQQYPLPTPTKPTKPTPSTASKKPPAIVPGTPTPYGHPVGRPCYVDRVECPYAVFRFRGR